MAKTKTTYIAACTVCYSCIVAESAKKADVERAATSHMNAYQHSVNILTKS